MSVQHLAVDVDGVAGGALPGEGCGALQAFAAQLAAQRFVTQQGAEPGGDIFRTEGVDEIGGVAADFGKG